MGHGKLYERTHVVENQRSFAFSDLFSVLLDHELQIATCVELLKGACSSVAAEDPFQSTH